MKKSLHHITQQIDNKKTCRDFLKSIFRQITNYIIRLREDFLDLESDFYNSPMNFKQGMMIPESVRYKMEFNGTSNLNMLTFAISTYFFYMK